MNNADGRTFVPNSFQCPNDYVDNYLKHLTGAEAKILLIVTRKTIGWHKDIDRISISQFMEKSGLSNRAVIDATRGLVNYGLLERVEEGYTNGTPASYRLQLDKYKVILKPSEENSLDNGKPSEISSLENGKPSEESSQTKNQILKQKNLKHNARENNTINFTSDNAYLKAHEFIEKHNAREENSCDDIVTLDAQGDTLVVGHVTPISGGSGLSSESPLAKSGDFSQIITAAEELGFNLSEKELKSALRKTQNPSGGCLTEEEQRQYDIYNRVRDSIGAVIQASPRPPKTDWNIFNSGTVVNEGAKEAMDSYFRAQADDKYHVDYGKFPPDLIEHIKRFVELSGVYPITKQDYKNWQSIVVEWREAGLSVSNIERAVQEIKSHNRFRISSPRSITGTAKAIMFSERR